MKQIKIMKLTLPNKCTSFLCYSWKRLKKKKKRSMVHCFTTEPPVGGGAKCVTVFGCDNFIHSGICKICMNHPGILLDLQVLTQWSGNWAWASTFLRISQVMLGEVWRVPWANMHSLVCLAYCPCCMLLLHAQRFHWRRVVLDLEYLSLFSMILLSLSLISALLEVLTELVTHFCYT